MKRKAAVLALMIVVAGCGSSASDPAQAEAPRAEAKALDLAQCARSDLADENYRERKAPIPVPPVFAGMVASDMDHFAVSTMTGGTVCVDTGWMEGIEGAKASPDQRFLAFAWGGYEAFGYIVVDRTGEGQVIETGVAPLAPPTGMRFASLDLSESGFGGFNALGVWQIEPVGLRPLAKVEEGFPHGDWRMEGWAGDHCINLSVFPIDRPLEDGQSLESAPRDPWFVAEAKGWKPTPGRCPQA